MHLLDRMAHGSRLTRRHPAEKGLLAGGMLVLAVSLPAWPGGVMVLAAMLVLLGASGHHPPDLVRVFAIPGGFLLVGGLALVVSFDPWGEGPVLGLSRAGALTAAATMVRAAAGTACLVFLVVTTPLADLVWLLRRMGVPGAVVEIIQLTYRFIFLVADMAAAGLTAQQARLGWSGLRRSWRSAGLLGGALLPRALARARRMEHGLAARNDRGVLEVLTPDWQWSGGVVALTLVLQAGIVGGTVWLI